MKLATDIRNVSILCQDLNWNHVTIGTGTYIIQLSISYVLPFILDQCLKSWYRVVIDINSYIGNSISCSCSSNSSDSSGRTSINISSGCSGSNISE